MPSTLPRAAFPAMGTTCEVTLVGGAPGLLDLARRRVEELEGRWSRFRADSEISRLNARAGLPTGLSADSYLLVDHAVAGWRWSEGRYDPTVLESIVSVGYDRSFEKLEPGQPAGGGPRPAPGCAGLRLDPRLRAVTLPPGVGLDPGGIGKGLAADLVVEMLLDAGADGACVSLGGDGRVAGAAPDDGWRIGIGNPYAESELLTVVALTDHGIATSSRLIRRWQTGAVERHHLLDPGSGQPLDNGLDAVTVIADDAWLAEILTKAAFVAGPSDGARLLSSLGVAGLLVESLERLRLAGPFARFLVEGATALA